MTPTHYTIATPAAANPHTQSHMTATPTPTVPPALRPENMWVDPADVQHYEVGPQREERHEYHDSKADGEHVDVVARFRLRDAVEDGAAEEVLGFGTGVGVDIV